MERERGLHLLLFDIDAHAGRNGLTHVTDGEPSQLGEVLGLLDDEGLGGHDLDDGDVAGLQEGGVDLLGLAGLGVDGLLQLDEGAGHLSGVAVEHRGVTDRVWR